MTDCFFRIRRYVKTLIVRIETAKMLANDFLFIDEQEIVYLFLSFSLQYIVSYYWSIRFMCIQIMELGSTSELLLANELMILHPCGK